MFVTLKPSVFDPQGKTIADALHSLGYNGVDDVRQGKYFELELTAPTEERRRARWRRKSPTKLLANPVIESYRIEIDSGSAATLTWKVGAEHEVRHRRLSPAATATTTRITRRRTCSGQDAEFIWHKDTTLKGADVVILPGGFAHGDYLRTGAIARFSPIMPAILDFARAGGPVLGICNGFQVLLEAGLLPGAMLRNRDLKFHCEHVIVRVEQTDTPFTLRASKGQRLRLPVAHGEGNYYAAPDVVRELEAARRVIFRYCDARGEVTDEGEPERVGQQHRRHLQRGPQRRRPDAAPRARVRSAARQRRRPGAVRVRRDRAGAARRGRTPEVPASLAEALGAAGEGGTA